MWRLNKTKSLVNSSQVKIEEHKTPLKDVLASCSSQSTGGFPRLSSGPFTDLIHNLLPHHEQQYSDRSIGDPWMDALNRPLRKDDIVSIADYFRTYVCIVRNLYPTCVDVERVDNGRHMYIRKPNLITRTGVTYKDVLQDYDTVYSMAAIGKK